MILFDLFQAVLAGVVARELGAPWWAVFTVGIVVLHVLLRPRWPS